ncbi:MAG TPA: MCP four helix bundle domain-containing protein [Bacteroidota bacterium]|nr:MCP four helix bundle domain-containing protein [Bacteroidota bacterium]
MYSFSNLKIRTKLLAGFTIVALLACAIGFIGDLNMRLLDNRDTALNGSATRALRCLATASSAFHDLSMSCYTARLDSDDSLHSATGNERLHLYASIDENLRTYASIVTDSASVARVNALSIACRKFVDDAGAYDRLVQDGQSSEAKEFRRTVLDEDNLTVSRIFQAVSAASAQETTQLASDETSDLLDANRSLMFFLIGITAATALGLGLWLSYLVKRQFEQQEAFWIEQQPMGRRAAGERFATEEVDEPIVRIQTIKAPETKLADAPAVQNQAPAKKMRVFFDDTVEYNGNESLNYR